MVRVKDLKLLLITIITASTTVYFISYHENRLRQLLKDYKVARQMSDIVSNNGLDYLERFPNAFDCKNKYNAWEQASTSSSSDPSYNYSQEAPKELHKVRMTRALVVQFPIDKTKHYINEIKWLYLSWVYMMKHEPPMWRTDLLVFVENDQKYFKNNDFVLNELKCRFDNIRNSSNDPPMCTLINYPAFSRRKINQLDKNENLYSVYKYLLEEVNIFDGNITEFDKFYKLMKREINTYSYLDSILVGFEGYGYFKRAGYDFIIRSDMDVFLTPLFGKWLPRHCNDFNVGGGAWWHEFSDKRLKQAANRLGLKYGGVRDLGSTWYSTPDQIRLVSYLTLFAITYLSIEEFTHVERQERIHNWPEWHYMVVLLYGQSVMLNHLIATNQTSVVKLDQHIDFQSRHHKSVHQVVHIHAFLLPGMFNKVDFKAGKYDKTELNDRLLKSDDVVDYTLQVALAAKRANNSALVLLYQNVTSNKN